LRNFRIGDSGGPQNSKKGGTGASSGQGYNSAIISVRPAKRPQSEFHDEPLKTFERCGAVHPTNQWEPCVQGGGVHIEVGTLGRNKSGNQAGKATFKKVKRPGKTSWKRTARTKKTWEADVLLRSGKANGCQEQEGEEKAVVPLVSNGGGRESAMADWHHVCGEESGRGEVHGEEGPETDRKGSLCNQLAQLLRRCREYTGRLIKRERGWGSCDTIQKPRMN